LIPYYLTVLVSRGARTKLEFLKILLGIICGDSLFAIIGLVVSAVLITTPYSSIGASGCMAQGYFIQFALLLTIFSSLAQAILRYNAILHSSTKVQKSKSNGTMLISVVVLAFTLPLLPFISNQQETYFALSPALILCMGDYTSRSDGIAALSILFNLIPLASLVVILFCYTKVLEKVGGMLANRSETILSRNRGSRVRRSSGRWEEMLASFSPATETKQRDKGANIQNRLLLQTSLSIGLYCVAFMPFSIRVYFEIASGTSVGATIDGLLLVLVCDFF
jgi:hypothetical protein